MRDERLAGWVAKLLLLPSSARQFEVSEAAAATRYGLGPDVVGQLLDAGLPCARDDGGPMFDSGDLHFVGIRLGSAQMFTKAMRLWAKAIGSFGARTASAVTISYVPYGPRAESAEVLTVLEPEGSREVPARAGAAVTSWQAVLPSDWPPPDERLLPVLADVAALDFCLIPPSLREQVDVAADTGLADCALASVIVAAEARRLGLEARTSYGVLVSPPYSTPHYWSEVRSDDGLWVPFDPLLLSALHRFAGLDPELWPATRSLGAVVVRLASGYTPIVSDRGEGVDVTLLTSVSPA